MTPLVLYVASIVVGVAVLVTAFAGEPEASMVLAGVAALLSCLCAITASQEGTA